MTALPPRGGVIGVLHRLSELPFFLERPGHELDTEHFVDLDAECVGSIQPCLEQPAQMAGHAAFLRHLSIVIGARRRADWQHTTGGGLWRPLCRPTDQRVDLLIDGRRLERAVNERLCRSHGDRVLAGVGGRLGTLVLEMQSPDPEVEVR